MMMMVGKIRAFKVGLMFFTLVVTGCATQSVTSQWQRDDLTINGSEKEWPIAPQYYDANSQAGIRMMNDADAIYLCFSTSNEGLKKRLLMAGLTVWLDPAGGKDKTFGIHLPGAASRRGAGRPEAGVRRGSKKESQTLKTPGTASITFAENAGRQSMSMARIRQMGIHVGAGQPNSRRFVYEFRIGFKACPSLSALGPGKVLGIGVETEEVEENNEKPGAGETGMANQGGGGKRGGGKPGGGSSGKSMGESFEAWIRVTLSGDSTSPDLRG